MAIKTNFTAGLLSVTGDNADDAITVNRNAAGQILINGGAIPVQTDAQEVQPTLANTTEIDVFGGNGNDMISLDNVAPPAGQALPTAHLFGGNGNDTLIGGAGNDILDGGAGDDTVVGGKGTDTAFLGRGNDTFIWNPGDGNDVVDGGGGFDTLDFRGKNLPTGTNNGETFSIDANGSGATFNRTNGTIDLTSVERIQFEAQGQNADNITINDLTGTTVKQVAIDLGGGLPGGGDGQADMVAIKSNSGNPITVADDNGKVTVSGLASDVTLFHFEVGRDQLSINGQSVTVVDGQSVTVAAVSSDNTRGTSTASDGSHDAGLALLGQHMASSFVTAGDGHASTPIADQPSSQPPLLAQPHA
jgi:Ca2+-binding RTX toxin-like protein